MQTKNLNDSQFIVKITDIMRENSEILTWNENGTQLELKDIDLFCQKVLPQYFRHSNFNSFIRQLNIYSFYKTKKVGRSMSFKNEIFRKGNQNNFFLIQRKRKFNNLQNFQERFEKQCEQLISQVNNKNQITSQTKQAIISLLQYKYLSRVNLRRMKSEVNALVKELKDSRNQKIQDVCSEIKSDLLSSIIELNSESKRIDEFIQRNFLKPAEKIQEGGEPILNEKQLNKPYQFSFDSNQNGLKNISFTREELNPVEKHGNYEVNYEVKENLKSFNSFQFFFDEFKSKKEHFMFQQKLYLPFNSQNSFMVIPNYIPAPSHFTIEGKINFFHPSRGIQIEENPEKHALSDYQEDASMSFVKDFGQEQNCDLPVAN